MKEWLLSLVLAVVVMMVVMAGALMTQWPTNQLSIIMCDVGQGDAFLLTKGFTQVLVDVGPDRSVLECLRQNMPVWDRNIEMIILSHPDKDHIGGYEFITSHYSVETVMLHPVRKETQLFARFETLIQSSHILYATAGDCLSVFQDGSICVIWPQKPLTTSYEKKTKQAETALSDNFGVQKVCKNDCNNLSLVFLFSYGGLDVLFTGDIDWKVEQALIAHGLIHRVDVLKIPHHGAKTSSSHDLITATSPELSLMSLGRHNSYGHPDAGVISRLQKVETRILRTDQMGTVALKTDGANLWW